MVKDSQTPKLTNRFFFTFYCLLLYLLAKSLTFYYFNRSNGIVLIVSLGLIVPVIAFSLLTLLFFHFHKAASDLLIKFYLTLYTIAGLLIVFTEPSHILYMYNSSSKPNNSYFPMTVYIFLGSKNFLYTRRSFYISSLFNICLFSIFCLISTSSIVESIYTCLFLFILAIYKAGDIHKTNKKYRILITEQDQEAQKLEEIMTPMDEIMTRVKYCLQKLEKISNLASPKQFKIYKNMKTRLEFIIKELQSSNIYSPKMEVVTRHMDSENKLFIEKEFFESPSLSWFQSEHIHPRKVPDYDLTNLKGILSHISKEWNFNTFFVSECTSEIINVIGEYTIKLYRLDELLKLNDIKLKNILNNIGKNYYNNPYHNEIHAADVLCSFVYLLVNTKLKKFISSLEWLGSILACFGHDLRHPAKNNRYVIMTQHEYSVTYNDISVLEMMSASTLFKLLQDPNNNIFSEFLPDKFFSIRKLIIDLILSTDMSKHFEIVSSTRSKYSETIDLDNPEHRLDMFKVMIKSADIGHTAKSVELHEKWCRLVIDEFYAQGDLEKEKGIPVSMFCDRENANIGKSQAGFIKNVSLILFETLNFVFQSERVDENCIQQLKANIRFWENNGLRFSSEREVVTSIAENNGKRREFSV